MLKQSEAKIIILEKFDTLVRNEGSRGIPTTDEAFRLYSKLEGASDPALDFRCSGDKWQKIKSWLYQTNRIRDRSMYE